MKMYSTCLCKRVCSSHDSEVNNVSIKYPNFDPEAEYGYIIQDIRYYLQVKTRAMYKFTGVTGENDPWWLSHEAIRKRESMELESPHIPRYPSGLNHINKKNHQAKTNILNNHKAK